VVIIDKMTKKGRVPKIGEVWLVDSFAGVQVKKKITKVEKDGWWGVLIDKKDAEALHTAGVPYIEVGVEETVIFNFQVVKKLKIKSQKVNDKHEAPRNRKPRKKRRNRSARKSEI